MQFEMNGKARFDWYNDLMIIKITIGSHQIYMKMFQQFDVRFTEPMLLPVMSKDNWLCNVI